ncbi:MAG: sulfur carrier protein ThiS [Bacteroidales bacterium]|nr:sulfur carrier protein ThiS [Bacteroidales bacterium]
METLKINGIESQFPDGVPKTITELLKHLNINEATVVAELEGKIITRDNFLKTALSTGQKIELIRFVGGG